MNVMETLKKDRMADLALASGILTIAAMIFYAILAQDGEASSATVYVLAVVAVVCDVAVIFTTAMNSLIATIAGWAAAILTACSLMAFISERVQWLYALLSKMDAAPLTAMFPITIVVFCLAIIGQVVQLFFKSTAD